MAAHPNARLETFCDGVFAIALTLLVIDLKVPSATNMGSAGDLWRAIGHLAPSFFTFLLSFSIVFITWVNHHQSMKVVDKSSAPFIYANGFMLLTIVIIPFPTSLLGEHLLTDHASPAVVLYSATFGMQSIAWTLLCYTVLRPERLVRSDAAAAQARRALRDSLFALAFYTGCAIVAVWLPLTIAAVITAAWILWLFYGIRLKIG